MTCRTKSQVILLILLAECAFAQQSDIKGVVTDSTTGVRLPLASIQIRETVQGTATNTEGFYLISNVVPGVYEIVASYVGYQHSIKRVTVMPGVSLTVNFVLSQHSLELEEVTVTEDIYKKPGREDVSLHLIRQSEIRLVPVAVQEDVFRSLQILPGIVSTSDVTSQFHVRGGAGDQNLILLDGMRIYGPYHALGLFSIFDTDVIQSTEVYAGAYPPGFGGRLSSVLSFSSRDGRNDRLGVKASANFLSSKLQVESPLAEGISITINGRMSSSAEAYKKFLKRDVPLNFYDFFSKLTVVGGESHTKANFQVLLTDDRLGSLHPSEPGYRWRNRSMGGTVSWLLGNRLFMRFDAFHSAYEAERIPNKSSATAARTTVEDGGVRVNGTVYGDDDNLYSVGFEASFPSTDSKLVNTNGVGQRLKNTEPEVASWFRSQWTWDFARLDVGIRADVSSLLNGRSGLQGLEPRLSIGRSLFGDWVLKIAYGRFSQKFVTINNEDDLISVFDSWIHVPKKLNLEQADHYVGGVSGTLFETIGTNTEVYYKSYRSLVTYNRDKVASNDPDYVGGGGNSYGAEARLRYSSKDIELFGAYTLSWTRLKINNFEYPPRQDRRHHLNLLARVNVLEDLNVVVRWEFGTGFPFTQSTGWYNRLELGERYPGHYEAETGNRYVVLGEKNKARLPTYHRMDLGLIYRFGLGKVNGNVGFHVVNLYDRKNVFYFDRSTGAQVNMLPFFPSVTLEFSY